MPMRPPRTSRIVWSSAVSRSEPANRMEPPEIRPGGVATSRRMVRAVTDLPEPDSPTTAWISPGDTSQETWSTARTQPAGVLNSTTRSSIANSVLIARPVDRRLKADAGPPFRRPAAVVTPFISCPLRTATETGLRLRPPVRSLLLSILRLPRPAVNPCPIPPPDGRICWPATACLPCRAARVRRSYHALRRTILLGVLTPGRKALIEQQIAGANGVQPGDRARGADCAWSRKGWSAGAAIRAPSSPRHRRRRRR